MLVVSNLHTSIQDQGESEGSIGYLSERYSKRYLHLDHSMSTVGTKWSWRCLLGHHSGHRSFLEPASTKEGIPELV